MEEVPLVGGNLSASFRAGDTVRRRAGPWTPAVQALLGHLQRAGFDSAPAPLGTDEMGREVLSFVPGDVHVGWPDRDGRWSRHTLGARTSHTYVEGQDRHPRICRQIAPLNGGAFSFPAARGLWPAAGPTRRFGAPGLRVHESS